MLPPEELDSEHVCILSYANMIAHVATLGDQAKDEEFKALLWNTGKFLFDEMTSHDLTDLTHMETKGGVQ
jgi:hypothetical protein|tara:strand:+ start:589 stop:798 length:210 start_codon:yes stop_codon:yes gene_type:complete